ncbi:Phosphoglycerol transferase MdoB [Hathewaya proteolytica DSM 3090]|uniref:Phosphoglycerol transferase MdoB n=1 Tax=Hathewaya proteolytica DSM 3090 TaxID=1121331 RepID=A0A1M6JLS2_9CLOT|nr:LTA synthase family protein [Hathewaya proteolytica]SHJ47657.1 Phosphoglycerol transferase MdoB [Hathewaya proteolytica DSM 3090]
MNNVETFSPEIRTPNSLSNFIENLKGILHHKFFLFTNLSLLFKGFLLLILSSDSSFKGVNIYNVFFSVPPLLVYISFLLIFLSFSFLFKEKTCYIVMVILNILYTLVVIGDLWYFRSNSSYLTFHLINYTSNLNNLSDSIIAMGRLIDLAFIVDIPVLIFIAMGKFKEKSTENKPFRKRLMTFFILLIIPSVYLTYNHFKVDVFKKGFREQYLFFTTWTQNQNMFNLMPIGYHIMDGYNFYKDSKQHIMAKKDEEEIDKWFKQKAEILPDNKFKGIYKGKNIITLQVESLENFVIGQKVEGNEITPNLNKLLNNSIYFNNFIEQTNGGTTSDGEFLCNTSLFPVRRGSTFFRYPSNTYAASLPQLLEEEGYNTQAIHPDMGSYWNWMPALSSIGFNECYDEKSFTMDETVGLGLSDKSFLKQLVPYITKQEKPFYNFSITLSSHSPFKLPESMKTLKLTGELKGTDLGNYYESVHYTDKAIGDFIEDLRKQNLLSDSIIVIYGDHEGPHKFAKDKINSMKNIPDYAKDNNYEVPFIIYSEGSQAHVVETLGGQVDILPTICYLVGIDEEKYVYTSMGRNLLNTKRNYTMLFNGNIKSENLTKEEMDMLSKIPDYSNKIIETNYFKGAR